MKKKVLLIQTPDGTYMLDAIEVAKHRARHYTKRNSPEWEDEINECLSDPMECRNWVMNCSSWDDWKELCNKLSDIAKCKQSWSDFWTEESNFKLVEL